MTGLQIDSASKASGVTGFQRPEDGAWDPSNPNDFYFVTTATFTGRSRLWRLRFANPAEPQRGGTGRVERSRQIVPLAQAALPVAHRQNFAIGATRLCHCDALIAQLASRNVKVANHAPPPGDSLTSPGACLDGRSEFIAHSFAI